MDTSKNKGQDLHGFGPNGFPSTIRPSPGNNVGQLFDYGFNDKSDQLDNDFMDKFNLVNIDEGLLGSLDDQQDSLAPQPNGMGYGQAFSPQHFLQGGFPLWGGLSGQPNLITPPDDENQSPFFTSSQLEEDSSHFMSRFGFGFSPLIGPFQGPLGTNNPQPNLTGQQLTPQQQLHAETATQHLEKHNVQQKQQIKEKAVSQQQPAPLSASQNAHVQEQPQHQPNDEIIGHDENTISAVQDDKRPKQKVKQVSAPQKKEESKQTDNKRGKPQKIKMSFQEFCSLVGVNNDSSPSSAPSTDDDEEATRSLWIGNIGAAVSEKDLLDEFSAYGEVESIRILHQSFCAFVNFKTVECAMAAKKGLQGQIFDSQYIVINYRKATAERQEVLPPKPAVDHLLNKPSRALWVCNISDTIREEDLINEFEKYGEVESIRLIRNKSCAFVNFVSVERATDALHGMQSKVLGGLSIKINFAKTQPPLAKGREEGSSSGSSPSPVPSSVSPPMSPSSTSPATATLQSSPPSTAKPAPSIQQQPPLQAPSPSSQPEFAQFPQQMNSNNFNPAQQGQIPPTLLPYDNYSAYLGGAYNNFNYPINNFNYNMLNPAIDYSQLTCHLCFQALKDTVFVPCNHVSCSKCVIKLRTATVYKKDKGTKCPFCDTVVQKFVPLNYAEAFMQVPMQQQQLQPQMMPPHYPQQQQHMQPPIGVPNFPMHAPSEQSYRVK